MANFLDAEVKIEANTHGGVSLTFKDNTFVFSAGGKWAVQRGYDQSAPIKYYDDLFDAIHDAVGAKDAGYFELVDGYPVECSKEKAMAEYQRGLDEADKIIAGWKK